MPLSERFGVPASSPRIVQFAIGFYLGHLAVEWWISGSQIFLSLSVICTFIAIRKGHIRFRLHELYLPMALFLLGSTLSALASSDPLYSIREVSEWLSFLTFPLGLALYGYHERLIEKGALVLVVWASIISLYGLFQYLVLGHRDLEHRITGPTPHVMTFSGILLAIVFVAIVRFMAKGDRIYGLAAGLISVTLVLTLTRNAWLGWLAGAASLLLLKRSRLVLFLAPLALVALVLMPLPIFGRLVSTFDPTQYSNLDRIRMIEAGVEIIRDHPVFGVGPGLIDETYPLYRKPDAPRFQVPHLHNNFVQLWAERGVMAAAAYLLLFGMLAVRCFRDTRAPRGSGLAPAGLAATIALFVSGVFEFNFGDSEVLMTFLDVSALVAASIMVKEAGTNGSLPPVVEPGETPRIPVLPGENEA